MTRAKAFTLVEFLLSVSIVAILASILFPVLSQARASASPVATATNLRIIGMASLQYSTDWDDKVVRTIPSATDTTHAWSAVLKLYVPSIGTFFDPARPVPTTTTVKVGATMQPWYSVTNLSINDTGYSNFYATQGGTCAGRMLSYIYGRSHSAMDQPNKRVAFAPTTWGGTTVGYYYFRAYQASWISTADTSKVFSWNNMVWDTHTLYDGGTIPVVHADGSAGTLNRGNFKSTVEAPNQAAYCAWMATDGQRTWGSYWNPY